MCNRKSKIITRFEKRWSPAEVQNLGGRFIDGDYRRGGGGVTVLVIRAPVIQRHNCDVDPVIKSTSDHDVGST